MPATDGITVIEVGPPAQWDYDAITDRKRRRPPRVILGAEDQVLASADRDKLTATARDVVRNWTVASWLVKKHLDFVATFSFQARTGNELFDRRLEELVARDSMADRFDVAGRHGRARMMRLLEARATLDGDVFLMLLADGTVQAIEGDRVRTPPGLRGAERWTHGVLTSPAGRALAYALHDRRRGRGGFDFARILPARNVLCRGYFDRLDQVRGVSLFAPALNGLQDTYEVMAYATAKAKLAQMFGLKWTRADDSVGSVGDATTTTDDAGDLDQSETVIDFGQAPFSVDLDMGEDLAIVESNHPAGEMQEFARLLIMVSMKALDLPYVFWDEANTNYSGSRQAWLLYEESAAAKRADNQEVLNTWLAWKLGLWILDGRIAVPKSMALDEIRYLWLPKGLPWIDPLKEIGADIKAIEASLISRQQICLRRGRDWFDIADELAQEAEYLGMAAGGEGSPGGGGAPAGDQQTLSAARRRLAHVACFTDYLRIGA